MIFHDDSKIHTAVSYESPTFADLKYYLWQEHAIELKRIEPEQLSVDHRRQYINLVVDTPKRKSVSAFLDDNCLDRFSYVHSTCIINDPVIHGGVFIYPLVIIYSGTTIGKDVLIHGHSGIAHNVTIDQGTFLSGKVTIGGSAFVGKFCWMGMHAIISDKISIGDDVKIGANTFVRKSITDPGTYYSLPELEKF